ncbi:UdgX family uracil-DNA binding protein [Phenylobacterium sp.]|jgi:DNA polymerase|uniref:UdgX family uracil-DNA binding protein n=1 Tax=Phenylobacterium sp. TaxID=1871053 RepID=UPI002E301E69|nr:UdgX family uracil-DNA binding protein [Phenylobacterium sp.]HEX3365683.1 UdgX family uracil-DNA binding protein [Phenylobacterium sp.]
MRAGSSDAAIFSPRSLAALNRRLLATPPPASFSARIVPGEGPIGARLALVGEQPGDQEDQVGRPFVGPAGAILDRAMSEAGLQRAETYVTNAVKAFKFRQVGKRRIHQSPSAGDVKHYRWWLEQELAFVRPGLAVALGATAALALCGRKVAVTRARGPALFGDQPGYITVHPSSLLRVRDPHARQVAFAAFVEDLARAKALTA